MNKLFSFFLLMLTILMSRSQDTLHLSDGRKCPLEGSVKLKGEKKAELESLNRLKNRYSFPDTDDYDTTVTLKSFLKEGGDFNRFNTEKAVIFNAYVFEVKAGSVETCNCRSKELKDRDTHIELVFSPYDTGKEMRVIAEVTPRIRNLMAKRGVDWSTNTLKQTIKGKYVTIEGWLFFDSEHIYEAYNTDSLDMKGRSNWRATCWEVHPVTDIGIH